MKTDSSSSLKPSLTSTGKVERETMEYLGFIVVALMAQGLCVIMAQSGYEAQRCPDVCTCSNEEGDNHVECMDGWNQATIGGIMNTPHSLSLSGGNISVLPTGLFTDFSLLRELSLQNNKINTIEPGTFDGLHKLYYLSLENNEISEIAPGTFDDLQNLSRLLLENNNVSTIAPGTFDGLHKLALLRLSKNKISKLESGKFESLQNLIVLSLENNNIREIEPGTFDGLHNLTHLWGKALGYSIQSLSDLKENHKVWMRNNQVMIAGNNKIRVTAPHIFDGLQNLIYLNISSNRITSLDAFCFFGLVNLETLDARNSSLEVIRSKAFDGLINLKTMVLMRRKPSTDDPIVVQDEALNHLVSLNKLFIDDYRLCCEFVSAIPGFNDSNCKTKTVKPPLDHCGSLMWNHVLRVFIWIVGISALIGNSMVIIWRCTKETHDNKTHSFLVLNLAISDLIMVVYMLIIAIADLQFGEKYFNRPERWRSSAVCKIAGVLSVLSSEASVFFVTIISIECFLSIVVPFSPIKIREKTSRAVVCIIWVVAACLSIVPTVLSGPDSEVYGLSDVCIGLPLIIYPNKVSSEESYINQEQTWWGSNILIAVSHGNKPSWIYSIVLFIGVNMLCFMIVLCCYIAIFVSVKNTAKKVRGNARRQREIKMAIQMALIVGTDFACWMPVIIMGILSQTGAVQIGLDMYVWIAVFILPINSSLNPFLYTVYNIVATKCLNTKANDGTKHLKMTPLNK